MSEDQYPCTLTYDDLQKACQEATAEERARWAEAIADVERTEQDLIEQSKGTMKTFRLGCGNACSVIVKALRTNDIKALRSSHG